MTPESHRSRSELGRAVTDAAETTGRESGGGPAAPEPVQPEHMGRMDLIREVTRLRAEVTRCGLCGGYGAINGRTYEPTPCIACGKESEGTVLVYVERADGSHPDAPPTGQLRVIDGGGDDA